MTLTGRVGTKVVASGNRIRRQSLQGTAAGRGPAAASQACSEAAGIHGRAVRFGSFNPDTPLLVGEGIETVLSLVTALPGAALPETVAAAALSAGSLGAFVPPPGLSRLLIARDRDAEGQRAALRLQLRCTRLGIGSAVIVPDGGDFNDDLRAFGTERLAQRLATLATPHRASIRTAAPMRKE